MLSLLFSFVLSVSTADCVANICRYRDQLNEFQLPFYEGLEIWLNESSLQNGTNTIFLTSDTRLTNRVRQYVINAYSDGSNSDLLDHFKLGVRAFEFDHPEVFYVDYSKLGFKISQTTKGLKTLVFGAVTSESYIINNITNISHYIDKFNAEISNIKQTYEKTDFQNKIGDIYNKIGAIDTQLNNIVQEDYVTWINTAYGGLINKKAGRQGVAKAASAFLKAVNVTSMYVEGTVSIQNNVLYHYWNLYEGEEKLVFMDTANNIKEGAMHEFEFNSYEYNTGFQVPLVNKSKFYLKHFDTYYTVSYNNFDSDQMNALKYRLVMRKYTSNIKRTNWEDVSYDSSKGYSFTDDGSFYGVQLGISPSGSKDVVRSSPLYWSPSKPFTTLAPQICSFQPNYILFNRGSFSYYLSYRVFIQLTEPYKLVDETLPPQMMIYEKENASNYVLVNATLLMPGPLGYLIFDFQFPMTTTVLATFGIKLVNICGNKTGKEYDTSDLNLNAYFNNAANGRSFTATSVVLPTASDPVLILNENSHTSFSIFGNNYTNVNPSDVSISSFGLGSSYNIDLKVYDQDANLSEGSRLTFQIPFPKDYDPNKIYKVQHTHGKIVETLTPVTMPTGFLLTVSSFSPFSLYEDTKAPENVSLYIKSSSPAVSVIYDDSNVVNKVIDILSQTEQTFYISADKTAEVSQVFLNGDAVELNDGFLKVTLTNSSNVIEVFAATKTITAMERELNLTSVFVTSKTILSALKSNIPLSSMTKSNDFGIQWPPIFQEYSGGSRKPGTGGSLSGGGDKPSSGDDSSPDNVNPDSKPPPGTDLAPVAPETTEEKSSMSKPAYIALMFTSGLGFVFVVVAVFFISKSRDDTRKADKNILSVQMGREEEDDEEEYVEEEYADNESPEPSDFNSAEEV